MTIFFIIILVIIILVIFLILMENLNLKKADDTVIIDVESRPVVKNLKPKKEVDVIAEWFKNQSKNFNGSDPERPIVKKIN